MKKAAISGSTGFIGRHITASLIENGYEVVALPRYQLLNDSNDLHDLLQGAGVVIHLSGAPVLGRWTRRTKQEIYNSRILTTRRLVEAMRSLDEKPEVFICASAVGIYPSEGVCTENTTRIAKGFLAEVVNDWEQEALKASGFTRTLLFRFGMVLGKGGGALKTMALPFRFGVGGRIGSGRQMVPWIHIEDVCRAVRYAAISKSLFGALNLTSPAPVSNREFTRVLAKTLRRPALITVPEVALKVIFGQAATVVSQGQHVIPERLQQSGFQFRYPQLKEALADIFDKK